jgi:hypothetical protein
MNKSNFNEDFFATMREVSIWKLLSEDRDFIWTEALIDRYQNKIDWERLSGNRNVYWNASMLEKYKNKIDWNELSRRGNNRLFSAENLRKFSLKWNWKELSSNDDVDWTMEKVEEFKDFIDWGEFINKRSYCSRCGNKRHYTLEFFEKYKEYFPVSTFQQSALWNAILEIYKDKLIEDILAQ